jgi:hypothetical protein
VTLHERIAAALGWSVEDAQSFSLSALREVVRPVSADLAAEISEVVERGEHILVRQVPKRRWRS